MKKVSDLIYVGIKGTVVALERATGEQVWATHLKGWDYVNIALDGDQLLATTYGEIFCLDSMTGEAIWHNRLRGFGVGLASVATAQCAASSAMAALAAKQRHDQAAAAA